MSLLLLNTLGRRWYTFEDVGLTGLRLGVDIDFTSDPLSLTRDWVSVVGDVRTVSIRRGRSRSLDRVDAGTATVLLSNMSRQYEPGYTGSPYSPNVLPMRPIRIYAQIPLPELGGDGSLEIDPEVYPDGLVYPLFQGFIEAWHASWPLIGRDNVCVVEAVDIFKLFQQIEGRGNYAARILRNDPAAYWRLGAGSTGVIDWTGNGNSGTGSGVNPYGESLIVGDTDGSYVLDGVNDYVYFADAPELNPGDTFALSAWIQLSTLTADQSIIFKGSGGYHLYVDHISGGTGRLVLEKPGAGGGVIVASGTVITAGVPYHVGAIKDGTSDAYTVVNGTAWQVSLDASKVVGTTTDQVWLGRGSGYLAGTIDDVAIFAAGSASLKQGGSGQGALTTGTAVLEDMRRWYAVGRQEYPSTRVGSLIAEHVCDSGWVLADIYKEHGAYEIAAGTLVAASGSGLTQVQDLATSDGAVAYVRADGYVVYQGYDDLNIPTQSYRSKYKSSPTAIFGDGGGTEVGYFEVSPMSIDDEVIYNVVAVTAQIEDESTGFTGYTAVDMASVQRYGERSLSISTRWVAATSSAKLLVRSEEELERFKDPVRRIGQLRFAPAGLDDRSRARLYSLDISDRYTFRRRPFDYATGGAAGTIEYDVFVEGLAHDIDATGQWIVAVDVSEA